MSLQIHCLADEYFFEAEVNPRALITTLREGIHAKLKVYRGHDVPLQALTLYKADISLDPEENRLDRARSYIEKHQEKALDPAKVVTKVFELPLDPEHLHILVEVSQYQDVFLHCIIFEDTTENIFVVKIAPGETVSALKSSIKLFQTRHFANISSTDIELFKVLLPRDGSLPEQLKGLDFNQHEKLSSPTAKISALFEDPRDDVLHIVARPSRRGPPAAVTQENDDRVPALPQFTRYQKVVNTPGKTPSEGCKSSGYRAVQVDEGQTIYDGLNAPGGPRTIAPPITIFHSIFDKFNSLVKDASLQLTAEDLTRTEAFMCKTSTLPATEDAFAADVRDALSQILEVPVVKEENDDKTRADGTYSVQVGTARAIIFFLEVKKSLGEGGGDPFVQAGIVARRSWIGDTRKDIRDRCCCPTFMIAGATGWLGIMGSVFPDRIIVQRLTGIDWTALSSTQEDRRVYELTRTFVALRICLQELDRYYQSVALIPPVVPGAAHPRYFPYPTSYIDNGVTVSFRYLRYLEDDPQCVTFLAERLEKDGPTGDQFVVKYVTRYGKEVHKFLADQGHAPELRYCGPLTGEKSPAIEGPPGLQLGPMLMVVMDYIDARSHGEELPATAHKQVLSVLGLLHAKGYVLGDLRRRNLLVDRAEKVWFIDFDWSGAYREVTRSEGQEGIETGHREYARYPLRMSVSEGMWAEGMKALELIKPEHDQAMAVKLFA